MWLPLSSSSPSSSRYSPRRPQEPEQCLVEPGCIGSINNRPSGYGSPSSEPVNLLGVWIILFLFILLSGWWCFYQRRNGRSIFPCLDPPSGNALKESEYRNGWRRGLSQRLTLKKGSRSSSTRTVGVKLERETRTTMDNKGEDEGEDQDLEPNSPQSPYPLKAFAQDESAGEPLARPPPVLVISDVRGVEHQVDSGP